MRESIPCVVSYSRLLVTALSIVPLAAMLKFGIQAEQLQAMIREMVEMKLHLASMSDADVEDNGES